MDATFILNPAITSDQIETAIEDRFAKTQSLLQCCIFAADFMREEMYFDFTTLYYAFKAIHDLSQETEFLHLQLSKRRAL